jgi:hypothetical protein
MLTRSTEMPAMLASQRESGRNVERSIANATATTSSRAANAAVSLLENPRRIPTALTVRAEMGRLSRNNRETVE